MANGGGCTVVGVREDVLTDPAKILSGDFSVRKITGACQRFFSGFVYNLETTEGYYLANGYASHNCRCAEALVIVEPELSAEERA